MSVPSPIVARYGGIQLHADRFKHINNVARILIQESGIGLQVRDPAHATGGCGQSVIKGIPNDL